MVRSPPPGIQFSLTPCLHNRDALEYFKSKPNTDLMVTPDILLQATLRIQNGEWGLIN